MMVGAVGADLRFPVLAGLTSLGFTTSRFAPEFFVLPNWTVDAAHIFYGAGMLALAAAVWHRGWVDPRVHTVLSPLAAFLYCGKSLAILEQIGQDSTAGDPPAATAVRLMLGHRLIGVMCAYVLLLLAHWRWHDDRARIAAALAAEAGRGR